MEFLAINLFHHARERLRTLLRESPGPRRYYSYEKLGKGQILSRYRTTAKDNTTLNARMLIEEPLYWALEVLTMTDVGFTQEDVADDVGCLRAAHQSDHIHELQDETKKTERLLDAATDSSKESVTVVPGAFGSATQTEHLKFKPSVKQPKTKTRGSPAATVPATPSAIEGVQTRCPAVIRMKTDCLSTISKAFPSMGGSDFKGIVEWNQFTTAMIAAGCSATHIGGSAVSFGNVPNVNTGKYGTIVFHKPHPEATLDLIMLRINGRMLRRRRSGVFACLHTAAG